MKNLSNFDFSLVPSSWALCFNTDCNQKEHCMRFFVGESLPKNLLCGMSVYPIHGKKEPCRLFVEKRIIKVAWGFHALFDAVKVQDATLLRTKVKRFLGGHGTFYRYMNGEKKLTPEQQEHIFNIFRAQGYAENLTFDHYTEQYNM